MVNPTTRFGSESENEWYECVQREKCGHIGVHPRGKKEKCPNCGSNLEIFDGPLFVCGSCGQEHIAQGDAEDCCQ